MLISFLDRPPIDSFVDESKDSFIMLVSATDLDSTTNAEIIYSVDLSTEFNMDSNTGILTTKIPLDRETISTYSPKICATDGGTNSLSVCQLVSFLIVHLYSSRYLALRPGDSSGDFPFNVLNIILIILVVYLFIIIGYYYDY